MLIKQQTLSLVFFGHSISLPFKTSRLTGSQATALFSSHHSFPNIFFIYSQTDKPKKHLAFSSKGDKTLLH